MPTYSALTTLTGEDPARAKNEHRGGNGEETPAGGGTGRKGAAVGQFDARADARAGLGRVAKEAARSGSGGVPSKSVSQTCHAVVSPIDL